MRPIIAAVRVPSVGTPVRVPSVRTQPNPNPNFNPNSKTNTNLNPNRNSIVLEFQNCVNVHQMAPCVSTQL